MPAVNVDKFISRWQDATGSELANAQLFLIELVEMLELPRPERANDDTIDNAYVFERRVEFKYGDGTVSSGRIDLYRRGCFVLEAKKVRESAPSRYDSAMLRARAQAEDYARALPTHEGRPPFVVVVDVGRSIELYSEFTRSGATYVPFPDPRSHRILLKDLRDEKVRERLAALWSDPISLDPGRRAAKVTREIAAHLALLARTLEARKHHPETVAGFLTRCLFTLFAEDVGLLPKRAFTELLADLHKNPQQFVPLVGEIWKAMDTGAFSAALRTDLLKFNGKLFKDATVLPLEREDIGILQEAASADWQHVEPAIFGTLLERALDPEERHALGAHYTPRAYVERLVMPTVIEPLREDWKDVQAAALTAMEEGDSKEAIRLVREFHRTLCETRVLDPACGSGNFLYVTLEHMKRLEGEVLNQLEELGDKQGLLELRGVTVDPHQFLGIELNPRAAAVAEMVLWIGYLQWHFRTRGNAMPPEPVLKDFHNIENRDAVLAYDRVEFLTDERGVPKTRWDGKSTKKHPVTGEDVPDESKQAPIERYVNPRKAAWPQAEFVVGNPPFIGTKRMRHGLGDGYVDALRGAWPEVPDSSDFVMYWWDHAARLVRAGGLRTFGLITTNSIRQAFNRAVVVRHLEEKDPLSISYTIPDHPWVDSADGASVRIAMSVGVANRAPGRLAEVVQEESSPDGEASVLLKERVGTITSDLRIGADVVSTVSLMANDGISGMGVALHGAGFILDPDVATKYRRSGAKVIKGYLGGRDLLQVPRERYLIDFSGMTIDEARQANPVAFQHVLDHVKPERDHNNRKTIRELWWRFGWERPLLRKAITGLSRYIGTTETSKHRVFQFIDARILADHMIVCVATESAIVLATMSSYIHSSWSLAAGGRLGVGNDPRYNKNRCLDPFPFPDLHFADKFSGPLSYSVQSHDGRPGEFNTVGEHPSDRLRRLGAWLDSHRKAQQAKHPDLTLTGMYNVLEKLKTGEALTTKEKIIHEQGLVSVLKELHDDIDLTVLDAYGWSDLAALMQVVNGNAAAGTHGTPGTRDEAQRALDEALLERLVALNAERAAEEQRGQIRWLRPEFQNPSGARPQSQVELDTGDADQKKGKAGKAGAAKPKPWPKTLTEQVKAVADVVTASTAPQTEDQIAAHFASRGRWRERLSSVLEMLVALGRARRTTQGYAPTR